ncbi:MAG: FAD-dependent oxidoreductase, partial [Flavobacteriales bacterium]
FNTKVSSLKENEITVENGTKLESDFTIIATEASSLISNLKNQPTEWKSCETFYFETSTKVINKKLIGLIPQKGTLINNIFYHTSLDSVAKPAKELLSVTVIDSQGLAGEKLKERVIEELKKYCGIDNCHFVKQYSIPMALPNLDDLDYEMLPSETHLTNTLFLAGDTQLNGSLNAAMISGERAALAVINAINK